MGNRGGCRVTVIGERRRLSTSVWSLGWFEKVLLASLLNVQPEASENTGRLLSVLCRKSRHQYTGSVLGHIKRAIGVHVARNSEWMSITSMNLSNAWLYLGGSTPFNFLYKNSCVLLNAYGLFVATP